MKFNTSHKPELFTSKDETRPHLTQCYLDVDAKKLVATDGHRMIVLPVECGEQDHTGYISEQALDAARKADKHGARTKVAEIAANGALVTGDNGSGGTFPRSDLNTTGPFPPYERVIQENRRNTVRFRVNARYLAEAAKALGTNEIEIEVQLGAIAKGTQTTIEPIHVRNEATAPGALCLIMPMRL